LFVTVLYNPYVANLNALNTTGGDGNAEVTILGTGNDYVILQTTSRIIDATGNVFKDIDGNANYVNSTWVIRKDGNIALERTLYTPTYAVIPSGYRWYPFYSIHQKGFDSNATFYLFNTTNAYTYNVSESTYLNDYTKYPELPNDGKGYFGVAAPFANGTIGGEGMNNIVLVYNLADFSDITEWKSDCFTSNSTGFGGTEFGAVHEFNTTYKMTTHTYRVMIRLTHDPVTEQNSITFADYFIKNPTFPLVEPILTSSKPIYDLEEPFVLNISATFNYNLTNLNETLTLTDDREIVLWFKNYGKLNVSEGETWSNVPLLNQTISAVISSGNYTFTFRLLSNQGIEVGSSSEVVKVKTRQFGKARVGLNTSTSFKDYKMGTRYLMPEDGVVTSISMWFGNQGFEAKVAIYKHPEGNLIVQSQSESITSIGWHNFTLSQPTFIFSGFYALSWKNSKDAIVAYDRGLHDQSGRNTESYSAPFSQVFGLPEYFATAISVYATYEPAVTKVGVSSYPQNPSYDNNVTVVAYAKGAGMLTEPVVLSFSANIIDWVNVAMNLDQGIYTAQIPSQPFNTSVYYKVSANDLAGYPIGSEMLSYQVADFEPPTISYFERTPMSPNYNETVSVSARVIEPPNASGVKLVILHYWNGSSWSDIAMTAENTQYKATLPALPYKTTVNYTIVAFDYAGNVATMDIYSYTIADNYAPIARIDEPSGGSYLSGEVNVTVVGNDTNMNQIELSINGTTVLRSNSSATLMFKWNSTNFKDGTYVLRLTASDKAGNIAEQKIDVTIDNTSPQAIIQVPSNGTYLRGVIPMKIVGNDTNLYKIELYISGNLVQTWHQASSEITYDWNTTAYANGFCPVKLVVYDKAQHNVETEVSVIIDNSPPTIKIPTWAPEEPSTFQVILVTVEINDNLEDNIQNVTLWYVNSTSSEWQFEEMTPVGGKWIFIMPDQKDDTVIRFYIESYDKAGNIAKTLTYQFNVKGHPNVALGLLLSFVLLGAALFGTIGTVIYIIRQRKSDKASASIQTATLSPI